MKNNENISDEQLNALLDNELDVTERARLLEAIRKDKQLAGRYCDMRQIKDMVALAYNDPPLPRKQVVSHSLMARSNRMSISAAAAVLLLVGAVLGWGISASSDQQTGTTFYTVDRLNPDVINSNRVLLHIATNDDARVSATLEKVEELLQKSAAEQTPIEIEVVANADGLNMLRTGSPYVNRIKSIAQKYDNVSFMACGVAKQNAKLREGKEVALIPEAMDIPAALDQILKRVKGGWAYVRG